MHINPIDEAGHRPTPRAAAELHPEPPKAQASQAQAHPPPSAPTSATESVAGGQGHDVTAPPAFVSPVIRFDSSAGIAVLQYRDGTTGEPQLQYPSQRAVMEYREQMRASRAVTNADLDSA